MTEQIEVFIGKQIEKLRKNSNETQKELADSLGIRQQTLSLYEKGDRAMNVLILKKIAERYNISADYLLGLSDVPQIDATAEDAFRELERVKANYQKYIAEVKSITEKQNALQ